MKYLTVDLERGSEISMKHCFSCLIYYITRIIWLCVVRIFQVDSKAAFWEWIEEEFIPGVYDTNWYNGQRFIAPEGYISSRDAFLVGMPRFKQVRVKEGKKTSINK